MKSILVPTDFSKNAYNAVKYAVAYAEKTKSKIILFHTYQNPTGKLVIPFTSVVHIGKQEAKEGAELKMKKLIATLSKIFPNIKPKWETQPGMASDNIIEYVKKNKIDLIIMGTTGQGAVMRALVGSTTSQVINNTACTMIAVPPKAKFKEIHHMAMATNLETIHSFAETELVSFAKKHHTEITFVYIQDLATYNSEELLKKIVDKTKKHLNYKKISMHVYSDSNVRDGLNQYIKKQKLDMLSMISHGTKFPETIWKTSWTNEMANHATIPLLILHHHNSNVTKKAPKKIINQSIGQ